MRRIIHCYSSAFLRDSLGGRGGMRVKSVGDIRGEVSLGAWWRVRPSGGWFVRNAMEKITIEPLRGGAKKGDNLWQLGNNE